MTASSMVAMSSPATCFSCMALSFLLFTSLAPLASPRALLSRRRQLGIRQCTLLSTTYHPSDAEQEWTQNVQTWANKDVSTAEYCRHLEPAVPGIHIWMTALKHLQNSPSGHANISLEEHKLFSFFRYTYDCGEHQLRYRVDIEPLVGSLRHPLFACDPLIDRSGQLFVKDYLLLGSSHLAPFFSSSTAKVYFFDLGASLYPGGQFWFVERMLARGFEVDGYYGWELKTYNDSEILGKVPKWLLPRYHYYNIAAPTGPSDPGNPLNMMKAVAKPEDYVLFKLDIDNTPVEMEFIHQLMNDSSLLSLVDEFFFEHHVNFQPMIVDWFTQNATEQLHDSYAIFSKLRHLGIRAHGWI